MNKNGFIIIIVVVVVLVILGIVAGCMRGRNRRRRVEREGYAKHENKINKKLTGVGCDSSFVGVGECHEQGEAEVADKYAKMCKSVLEIGAGSGKVSHYINKNLKDRTRHYVVEPGEGHNGAYDQYKYLLKNRNKHHDKYHIDRRAILDIPLKDIHDKIGKIDCIVSDCEGCTLEYYKKHPEILKEVKYIMNEMDGGHGELQSLWKKNGFTHIDTGCGCGGCSCDTEIWKR